MLVEKDMNHKNYMYVGPYIKPATRETEIVKKSLVCTNFNCQKHNSFLRGNSTCASCGSPVVAKELSRAKVKQTMTVDDMLRNVFKEEEAKEIYQHWQVDNANGMLHAIETLIETVGHYFDKKLVPSKYFQINPIEYVNIDLNCENETWNKAKELAEPLIRIAKKYGFDLKLDFGVVHVQV